MDLHGNPLEDEVVDVSMLQFPPLASFFLWSDCLVEETHKRTSYTKCVDWRFHHTKVLNVMVETEESSIVLFSLNLYTHGDGQRGEVKVFLSILG
jgi:hypothetical protein